MEKTLIISGKRVRFKATALTPRLYREKIGRDLFEDLMKLRSIYKEGQNGGEKFSALDLGVFEDIAYIMAKQADACVPDTEDAWLDQFEIFSIYTILPELLGLWNLNLQTTATPKKA